MTNPKKAAWISFLASFVIFALKYLAFEKTNSAAIFSDAMESIVNVIAAGLALVVMRAVATPADEDHPYGHGKLEFFSAAFEGGLITLAGLVIAREAILALLHGREPHDFEIGFWLSVLTAGLNLVLGLYLLRTARIEKSVALQASGRHVLSDVGTTAAALVGFGLVKLTGLIWLDPLAGLLLALNLSFSGYKIARQAVGALIDEVAPEFLGELAEAFEKNRRPGVVDIHLVKMIRSGKFHHIDGHLVVPEFWQVDHAHELMDAFEKDVVASYPFDGEINFHLDPCNQRYCSVCELPECPIRRRAFHGRRRWTAAQLAQSPSRDEEI